MAKNRFFGMIVVFFAQVHFSFLGMGMSMSTSSEATKKVPVAYYDEIKDLPKHREKLLVDVREPSELQSTGRIPMSINVPLGDVQKAFSDDTTEEQFARLYNHTKPHLKDQIIVSCQSGRRSQIAAETLTNLGYKQIKNYKGSWLEWAEKNGLPK
ncbi:putative thiosulfate sulfurtransferase, mitochondrial [Pseudolycoriella hygida]|uniref:Thiosulfate sulfurtransferase, mitochondrial n=1 Tax=Pseudolycoriella hygida TaxID=35572 RepID=A0A9Q0NCR4_9DIPT|nr:putative thiosulfate sulfurtransferase, mitochondrial [Pseudolycoriella hygida]